MVHVVAPKVGEAVYDPGCGTGGRLPVRSWRSLREGKLRARPQRPAALVDEVLEKLEDTVKELTE